MKDKIKAQHRPLRKPRSAVEEMERELLVTYSDESGGSEGGNCSGTGSDNGVGNDGVDCGNHYGQNK